MKSDIPSKTVLVLKVPAGLELCSAASDQLESNHWAIRLPLSPCHTGRARGQRGPNLLHEETDASHLLPRHGSFSLPTSGLPKRPAIHLLSRQGHRALAHRSGSRGRVRGLARGGLLPASFPSRERRPEGEAALGGNAYRFNGSPLLPINAIPTAAALTRCPL